MAFFKTQAGEFRIGNTVGAIALGSLISAVSATTSSASADSTWVTGPSWAVNDSTASSKRGAYKESRYEVSPFSPDSNNFAVEMGQVFLMGDLGSNYSDNIGAQLHYTYGVSDLFGFDSSLGYSEHSEGKFSMTTLLAGVRTNLAWYDRVVPYVVFGLGFYRPSRQTTLKTDSGTMTSSVSPILFGVHLGPGVDLEMTKQLFFGASLTFHDVFGSKQTTASGPIEVGGTFTSFLLRVGLTF